MTRQVWKLDKQGRPTRLVTVETIEEPPKWSRIILPLLFLICVVVAVGLNSAGYGGGR